MDINEQKDAEEDSNAKRERVKTGKTQKGWEEFGEVEENANLRKAGERGKLSSPLSPTLSLPVPAVNQSSWSASDKGPPLTATNNQPIN